MTTLPQPRGPISSALIELLSPPAMGASAVAGAGSVEALGAAVTAALESRHSDGGLVEDDDVQLALFCMYELHYGGFADADDAWEWDPDLLRIRAQLEGPFEAELRARVPVPTEFPQDAEGIAQLLFGLAADDDSPSTAKFIARKADLDQVRDFLKMRSIYQLKEADPHTWAIPRLRGAPKAALVEIQTDEYGGGDLSRMHSRLFGESMVAADLDPTYGAYLNAVPGYLLASSNMMSLFGLHRRLRGAIVGHLAAYEMTSSIPCRQVANGLRRINLEAAAEYFDEHVEADAVHEQIAGRDLAGRLGETEPHLIPDIVFGAAACLTVDGWAGAHMLAAWEDDREAAIA